MYDIHCFLLGIKSAAAAAAAAAATTTTFLVKSIDMNIIMCTHDYKWAYIMITVYWNKVNRCHFR